MVEVLEKKKSERRGCWVLNVEGDASREVESVGQRNGGESCFHTIFLQF